MDKEGALPREDDRYESMSTYIAILLSTTFLRMDYLQYIDGEVGR
jgi:hypothetical protein